MSLEYHECRLATPNLVDRYNELELFFQRIEESLVVTGGDKRFLEQSKQRDLLIDLLRRQRYRVGFLGLSQVGKSTTLNGALGKDVLPMGDSKACTSAVICTGFVAPGEKPFCRLNYMTPERYQSRRLSVGKLLGFFGTDATGEEFDDADLKKQVQEQLDHAQGAKDETVADRQYFVRLLQSHAEYGNVLCEPAKSEEKSYDNEADFRRDLKKFAQHPDDPTSTSPYALLDNIELLVPSDELPEILELDDLPGLGAKLEDDDITDGFIREKLDGAFVFQSITENLQGRETLTLVRKLKERFRQKLLGRVWIVFAKADGLSRPTVQGPSDEEPKTRKTILNTLDAVLKDSILGAEQAMIVSNEFFRDLHNLYEGTPQPELYASLKLEVDTEGHPVFPEAFQQFPELLGAYRDVATDGGIGRVRRIVKEEVASSVRREVNREIRERLLEIVTELIDLVSYAQQHAAMGLEDFAKAEQWAGVVRQVGDSLSDDPSLLDEASELLRQKLWDVLNMVCSRDSLPRPDSLSERHRTRTHSLVETAKVKLSDPSGVLSVAYQQAGKRLERFFGKQKGLGEHQELEPKFLPKGIDPSAELERLSKEEANEEWYLAEVNSMADGILFPRDPNVERLNPGQYRDVLEQKIEGVVYSLTHCIGNRLLGRLRWLEERLEQLSDRERGGDDAENEVFEEILAGLGELRGRISRNEDEVSVATEADESELGTDELAPGSDEPEPDSGEPSIED